MAGSVSGRIPFTEHDEKLPRAGRTVCRSSGYAASGPPTNPSGKGGASRRNLRRLLGEPEVRVMMRADGVNEELAQKA
jgi:hypothetical protein